MVEKGTCIWITEFGSIKRRVFTILGRKDDKVKIDFGNEILIINAKSIRANRVIIYKTSKGKIIVQNPDKWKDIDLKKYGIKELRFNLQNMALQEGRAAIHRWTLPQDRLAKLSPLFKLLMICIVIGVIGWSALKFGTYVLDVVTAARSADCMSVIPRLIETPIGVPTNVTQPIG